MRQRGHRSEYLAYEVQAYDGPLELLGVVSLKAAKSPTAARRT